MSETPGQPARCAIVTRVSFDEDASLRAGGASMATEDQEATLRRVIREELSHAG